MKGVWWPGDRVMHPASGPGVVIKLLARARVLVRFDAARLLPKTVSAHDLKYHNERSCSPAEKSGSAQSAAGRGETTRTHSVTDARSAESPPEPEPEPAPEPLPHGAASGEPQGKIDGTTAELRQTIEALRMGVVPSHYVRDYTVGRASELADLSGLLELAQGMRVIWGDYGAGKTHILDVAEQSGLEAGYLTSRIVLNPRAVPPSHPQRLYRAFIEKLRYPDDVAQGWKPLLMKLETSNAHIYSDGAAFSRFFSPVLYTLRYGDQETIDWLTDYIEGYRMDAADVTKVLRGIGWRGPNVLTLSDFRTYGRMYILMLGTLASWAKDVGYRGLLLLMDEVEYVDSLSAAQKDLASEVLKHFATATLPQDNLEFDPQTLYKGGHKVHRNLDIRCRPDQPLLTLMALTPLDEMVDLAASIVGEESVYLHLQNFKRKDYAELAGKIVNLYERAYVPFEAGSRFSKLLRAEIEDQMKWGGQTPREAVRAAVSFLDAARYGRDPFEGQPDSVSSLS